MHGFTKTSEASRSDSTAAASGRPLHAPADLFDDDGRLAGILRRGLERVNVPGGSFVEFADSARAERGLDLVGTELLPAFKRHG